MQRFDLKLIFWQEMLKNWQKLVLTQNKVKRSFQEQVVFFYANLKENEFFGKRCLKFGKSQVPKQNGVKCTFLRARCIFCAAVMQNEFFRQKMVKIGQKPG